jgi:RimJ/RimL family protein N-acetyltransferase
LELLIEPTNGASRRVAEALGAVQEELLLASEVIQGVSRDLARFVLTPAEVRE